MKPYKPSNIAPTRGIQLLLLAAILGGILTGGIFSFISRFIYLIVLFPAVMGGTVGFTNAIAVKTGKVRNPILSGAIAVLAGLIAYGSLNFGQYLYFRQTEAAEITKLSGIKSSSEIDGIIDSLLQEKTQATGFVGYIKSTAQDGINITRRGRDSGITLNETFTYAYWLLEIAIIGGIAFTLASNAAQEPFCEEAQDWYGDPTSLASVELKHQDQFIKALNNQDYEQAGTWLKPEGEIEHPRLDLLLHLSPAPDSDRYLKVNQVSLDAKGKVETNTVLDGLISPTQEASLMQILAKNIKDTKVDGETLEPNPNLEEPDVLP
jgi:hypothetical protein